MKVSCALATAVLLATSQACYLTAHSSTVGDFDVQHSAPSDHGGAPQTITGSKGSCYFSGSISDSCTVTVEVNDGCGTLYFTIRASG